MTRKRYVRNVQQSQHISHTGMTYEVLDGDKLVYSTDDKFTAQKVFAFKLIERLKDKLDNNVYELEVVLLENGEAIARGNM